MDQKKLIIILNGFKIGKASMIEFVINLFPGLKSAAKQSFLDLLIICIKEGVKFSLDLIASLEKNIPSNLG